MRIILVVWLVTTLSTTARGDDNWIDYFSAGPFECRSEFKLSDSQILLGELQQLKADIESTLALRPAKGTIQLNLFRHKRNYIRYVSRRFPAGANRQALYIKGTDTGRIYIYRHLRYLTDVRHETSHAVLHNALPFLPLWLDEGLAEYFEVPADLRVDKHPHLDGLRWMIRFGWAPRLHALEEKRGWTEMRANDYRESWAWVHFMLHGPQEAQQTLAGYLGAIMNGDHPGLLSEQLARHVPNAKRRLVQHVTSWKSKSAK